MTTDNWDPSTFIRDGRLIRLPAKLSRQVVVLEILARATFEPGRTYDEKTVNDKLRAWTEGGVTDHVTIRRSLIDLRLLTRDGGVYRVPAGTEDAAGSTPSARASRR